MCCSLDPIQCQIDVIQIISSLVFDGLWLLFTFIKLIMEKGLLRRNSSTNTNGSQIHFLAAHKGVLPPPSLFLDPETITRKLLNEAYISCLLGYCILPLRR